MRRCLDPCNLHASGTHQRCKLLLTLNDSLSTACQVSGGVCHTGSPGAVVLSIT